MVALLAILSAVPLCHGADNSPVLDAIFRFVDALQAGNAEALRDSIWVDDENLAQHQGCDAWVAMAVAQKRLEKSAEAHFAGEGECFRCGFDLFLTPADRQSLATAPVEKDEGGGKRVCRDGDAWPLRVRPSSQGKWKVLLDMISVELDDDPTSRVPKSDAPSLFAIDRMHSMADVFADLAERIDRGDLVSASAATAELTERLEAIEKEYRRKMRLLPDRYRLQLPPW
jgi:hypothetical protein